MRNSGCAMPIWQRKTASGATRARRGRVLLTDAERQMLAEMGPTLGRQGLAEIATIAKPDTILVWHRKLMVQQGVRAQLRQPVGRPALTRSWKISWCGWPERIVRGAMPAL